MRSATLALIAAFGLIVIYELYKNGSLHAITSGTGAPTTSSLIASFMQQVGTINYETTSSQIDEATAQAQVQVLAQNLFANASQLGLTFSLNEQQQINQAVSAV